MARLEETLKEFEQISLCAGQDQSGEDNRRPLPLPLNLIIQRFEGENCEGQPSGEGVACFEGGHMYKGMFSKGLMDGHGVFTWVGGMRYEGNFASNIIIGQGMYYWPEGNTYQGEVYYGIRHGSGTYCCAKSGVIYKGQWHQGKRQGKGVIYFNQDETNWYKGDWVENRIEGRGVRRYLSGNTYTGEWMDNLRHGEGTMKWLLQRQQYEGTWHKGVQHGRGKHTWILKREDISRFPQCNHYVGDFMCGKRHGQGAFYFADGAIYEGGWRNNKKYGQGTITLKNGKIFQGEFADDQMVELRQDRPIPPLALNNSCELGPEMGLDIDKLLDTLPALRRESELKEVEFAVWKHSSELRSIYNFYSRLGFIHSSDNVFMLSRMQLWRLLKDCKVHHNIALTQIDLLIGDGATSAEVHSPFTRILFHNFLTCLIVIAYHIYHKDIISQRNLLASCFYKLMTNNILPNAKDVKGYLFKWQECTIITKKYFLRSFEVYQTYSTMKAASRHDKLMTYGELMFLFKDLNLFDNQLTVTKFIEVITKESADLNTHSILNLEMTFLEFFETLLGCTEVKRQIDGNGIDQLLGNPEEKTSTPVNSPISLEVEEARSHTNHSSTSHKEMVECLSLEGATEEDDEWRQQPREMLPRSHFKIWEQTVCHFFDQVFFKAIEQHLQICSVKDGIDLNKSTHQAL